MFPFVFLYFHRLLGFCDCVRSYAHFMQPEHRLHNTITIYPNRKIRRREIKNTRNILRVVVHLHLHLHLFAEFVC